jgi:hypothetical protein
MGDFWSTFKLKTHTFTFSRTELPAVKPTRYRPLALQQLNRHGLDSTDIVG